ncbi:metabotropic glutamate receptor 4-like [Antedon mediterranea]|uniref:metabotropic glutamate receptor 4-like n=1 Tax=Antedon mediterranea TaxID=105859 RepID=UPI003AF9D6EA
MMAMFVRIQSLRCLVLMTVQLTTMTLQSHIPDIKNNVYRRDGDVVIGVLADVHRPDESGQCVRIQDVSLIQRLEAIVFIIDQINSRNDILPTVEIGFEILDTCSQHTTTLSQAMRFIPPDSFRSESCTGTSSPQQCSSDIVAVIGTERSSTSISAAIMYGLIHLPMVSYFASSDDLTDTILYPYFMRVVPPDRFQVKAMVDLMLDFNWNYISVLYTDDSYGRNAVKNLMQELLYSTNKNRPICIANNIAVGTDWDSTEDFLDITDILKASSNSKVIVLIVDQVQANGFLGALRVAGLTGQFQIIGSDAWGSNVDEIDEDNLIVAQGSLKTHFHTTRVEAYEEYFQTLTPENNKENPWFQEYWDTYLSNITTNGTQNQREYTDSFSKDSSISLVMDTVMTIAYAMDSMVNDSYSVTDGDMLFSYMINTSFVGSSGSIEFDENGDLQGIYNIDTIQLVDGNYQIKNIGTWQSASENRLQLDQFQMMWIVNGSRSDSPIESICSLPCQAGHIRIDIDACCWTCVNCSEYQIPIDGECYTCLDDETTAFNRTVCVAIEPEYMHYGNAWAVALLVMAVFGVCVSTVVLAMFSKYNKHALIKASSRELSGIMLFGVFMSFTLVFSIISKPTMTTCLINRIGFMVCFTFTYAPLLVRVNRIYRIFSAGKKSTKRPKFISPRSQIVMASALIAVQLLINGVYLLKGNTDVDSVVVETHVRTILVCHVEFVELVGSLSYNLFLILCCTYYAFVTRKVPTNYNESRFISISAYTTLVIWLGFIPSYFLVRDTLIRASVMSLAMIFSAFVTLTFTFIPKLYAIMCLNTEKTQIGTYQVDRTGTSINTPQQHQEGVLRNKIGPLLPRPPSSVQTLENQIIPITNSSCNI